MTSISRSAAVMEMKRGSDKALSASEAAGVCVEQQDSLSVFTGLSCCASVPSRVISGVKPAGPEQQQQCESHVQH